MTKFTKIYVDYGIANRFGDEIDINKHLLEYPNLYKAILDHEMEHDSEGYTFKDFRIDFGGSKVNTLELIGFMFRHPKSLVQFLPLYRTKSRGWFFDQSLIYLYGITIFLISAVFFIAWRIS